jgi:hypothetical protein
MSDKRLTADGEFANTPATKNAKKARIELAALRRPVDREAVAGLLKKLGHGSWRSSRCSSEEWITIDTPIETMLDAIMELIGRSK